MKIFISIAIIIFFIVTPFLIWFISDIIITNRRLEENQEAWDEYSRDMTKQEKLSCYNEWVSRRKFEKGWKYYYLPRM